MRLAPRTPRVVAHPLFDNIAPIARLRRLVGFLCHFFAVGEVIAVDGFEPVAGLSVDLYARTRWQIRIPRDGADAAGPTERNIGGFELDLGWVTLAVKDEELHGALELSGSYNSPEY